jgi:hypothetical protein
MKMGRGATNDSSIARGDPVITTAKRRAETRPAPMPIAREVICLAVPLLKQG